MAVTVWYYENTTTTEGGTTEYTAKLAERTYPEATDYTIHGGDHEAVLTVLKDRDRGMPRRVASYREWHRVEIGEPEVPDDLSDLTRHTDYKP